MNAGRRLSGRYELGEILGSGGMSDVHLARDLRLHRDVAVKLLRADLAVDPSVNLRFQREAQNAAALNHPAIAAIYDTGEVDTPGGPLPYIVMEYVTGPTLQEVVRTHGPMRAHRAVEVIADACAALDFSHRRGIVHRDIKPANIMLGAAGSVKVVDFGIAKAVADSGHGVTQTGAVIGTAHYLSPEQARGDRVDARADVYSLGCVLYEISTGRPPFVGDSAVSVAYQHVQREPVAPSEHNGDLSPDLDAVVLKAMAKDPDDRYQSAAAMREDLLRLRRGLNPDAATVPTAVSAGRPVDAEPADPSRPTEQLPVTRPGRSNRRWLVAVVALAVLVVGGWIGIDVVTGSHRQVTVPDVRGQASAAAVAALQNGGFKTRVRQSADPTVSPGLVISTDPGVDTAVSAGGEVILNVSTGPPSEDPAAPGSVAVPDVSSLTYDDAVRALTAAGFSRFRRVALPSPPELKDRVLGTNPQTNRVVATATEVTVVLGTGRPPGA